MKTRTTPGILLGLLAFFLMMNLGLAQTSENFYTITGVVKDAGNKRPIAFASVFIDQAEVGTVTNSDGAFTLKIDKSLSASNFTISHLGYSTARFSISTYLREERHEFLLEPLAVLLQEVVITPSDARALVEQAIARIATNYPDYSSRLTGFYRETIKQRRDYISISEAVVEVDQIPYTHRSGTDRVKVIQGRKSGDVKRMDTLVVKLQGGPHVSMLIDIVKNPNILLDKEYLNYYTYELVDMVKIEDATNYVVEFKPRVNLPYPLYYGKLYISTEKLGITQAEFSLDISDKDKAVQNFVMRKPSRLRFTPTRTNYLVTYIEIDGKYHVNYVRNELEFFADWRARIFRTSYAIMSEMAVTGRRPDGEGRFPIRETFRPSNILADMVPVYFDEDFWGAYNVIEPDESIESAIQKFNSRLER
ncbi:MAG: carboxypeptidase-like regulatory domain-containing protein [Bacteroidales bacterium]|nr:carboxypeptidase-like regulatory domain-containing protein [Bacteroidales bacterium]